MTWTMLLLAGALLVAGTSAASAETIKLVERATTDAVLDLDAKGDSAREILTFANELYDEKNAKLVGTGSGLCIRSAPAPGHFSW